MKTVLKAQAVALALLAAQPAMAKCWEDPVPVRDVYVDYDGLTFHATCWNCDRHQTIVYMPGFGDAGTSGDPILHRDEFRKYGVLSIDPLNQGQSDHEVVTDLVPFMNEVIRRFMDHERIRRAYFVGHSVGAFQVLAFQDAYPNRVKNRVVLLDDGQISFQDLPNLVFPGGNDFGIPAGEYSIGDVNKMFCGAPEMGMTFDECVAGIDAYSAFGVEPTWDHLRKVLLITRDFSIPTIPGVSEALDSAFEDASLAFSESVHHAEWIQIPGAQHNLSSNTEWADATAEAIAQFLP
ncbi:alpha/beta hydrolase [Sorangium sp. So ce590]|uniref:alpha/beta fold hydrolase n=1 Tax=Sorangium sp. So ce590 TaxID=3133317 RepID=UPI003F6193A6